VIRRLLATARSNGNWEISFRSCLCENVFASNSPIHTLQESPRPAVSKYIRA